jgi:glycyl-tRNA synthetase
MLALLTSALDDDVVGGESRTLLRLHPAIAPVKAAVLPLSKKLAAPAERIAAELRRRWNVELDLTGSIGKRYRRQDEIGTPFCVTYDFDSEQDHKVTVRDRDSTEQTRIAVDQLAGYLSERLTA